MSVFYCVICQLLRDSDVVGYEVNKHGAEVCGDNHHHEPLVKNCHNCGNANTATQMRGGHPVDGFTCYESGERVFMPLRTLVLFCSNGCPHWEEEG